MGRPFGGGEQQEEPAESQRDPSVEEESGEEDEGQGPSWVFTLGQEQEWEDPSEEGVLTQVLRTAEEGDAAALPGLLDRLSVSVDSLVRRAGAVSGWAGGASACRPGVAGCQRAHMPTCNTPVPTCTCSHPAHRQAAVVLAAHSLPHSHACPCALCRGPTATPRFTSRRCTGTQSVSACCWTAARRPVCATRTADLRCMTQRLAGEWVGAAGRLWAVEQGVVQCWRQGVLQPNVVEKVVCQRSRKYEVGKLTALLKMLSPPFALQVHRHLRDASGRGRRVHQRR